MSGGRKIRSPEDVDRFRRAMIPVDQAFWESEQRFGIGRLERLVSPATLAAYQRGWTAQCPCARPGGRRRSRVGGYRPEDGQGVGGHGGRSDPGRI